MEVKKTVWLQKAIIPLITILSYKLSSCAIGCIDNSYHLKKKGDNKLFHYVQCNCDCKKYAASAVRGICPKCGHYHDPKEFNVLGYSELKAKLNLDTAVKENPAKQKKDFKKYLKKEINLLAKNKAFKKTIK